MSDAAAFDAFVRQRERQLQRAAWLLTGDWAAAEDLVQTALVELWRHWDDVESPLAYTHRSISRAFVRGRRRRWTGEIPVGGLPESTAYAAEPETLARHDLVIALWQLPEKQRVAVVLRFFVDLDEAGTAAAMGVSRGSVKTHLSRALARLREVPGLRSVLMEEGR
ncbi:MAG: SigE family RNA polymerase sigma factor [Candidatus Nanopelagicales bacterium]